MPDGWSGRITCKVLTWIVRDKPLEQTSSSTGVGNLHSPQLSRMSVS